MCLSKELISPLIFIFLFLFFTLKHINAIGSEVDDCQFFLERAKSSLCYISEETKEVELSKFSMYLKTLGKFSLGASWGVDLYQHLYDSNGYLKGQEATSREHVKIRIIEGPAGKKACKILSDPPSFFSFIPFLFECLSSLYIQTYIQLFREPTIFRFATLEAIGVHCENYKIKSLFMVSEFAPGNSIDTFVDKIDKNNSQECLRAISRVAAAFAQLHEVTKGQSTEKETFFSYEETVEKVSKPLTFLNYFTKPSTQKDLIMEQFSPFLGEIKKLYIQIAREESLCLARNSSLIHGDAHIKNIFYDYFTDRVTFIDFQTAIFSYRCNADPLKDLGCFLESLWLKLACLDDRTPPELYEIGVQARTTFMEQYIMHIKETSLSTEKMLQRIKYYMWSQLFDFFYSLDKLEYSQNTFVCLRYFLSLEFNIP